MRQIVDVLLRVAADLGHGGPVSEYRIESGECGYRVTLSISKSLPGPGNLPSPPSRTPPGPSGGSYFQPSRTTEALAKSPRQIEEFLGKLSAQFNVYELTDLQPTYPFLHPTFYTFSFLDFAGVRHGFDYRIECANHLDERYRKLVEEFDRFFETRRVFAKFFEGRRPGVAGGDGGAAPPV